MLLLPLGMHIPDGFLSIPVSLVFWLVSLLVIGKSLQHVNHELGEKQVPLMGVLAAAIFAGQMLNFAVAGGTSGHLLGAALATILLGPWAAVVVMTSVIATQALLFQDGGLVVLGANLFNMAIVGVFVAYAVYTLVKKIFQREKWGLFAGGFAAAWSSIFIASLACGLQLALSGTSPAGLAIPAMGGIHALIGIGEGLITTGALAFIYASRRDLIVNPSLQESDSKAIWSGGILISLFLIVLSPLASSHPDGLEWVARELGFIEAAKEPVFNIFPGYAIPGISSEIFASIIAGIIGASIVLIVAIGSASRRRRKANQG